MLLNKNFKIMSLREILKMTNRTESANSALRSCFNTPLSDRKNVMFQYKFVDIKELVVFLGITNVLTSPPMVVVQTCKKFPLFVGLNHFWDRYSRKTILNIRNVNVVNDCIVLPISLKNGVGSPIAYHNSFVFSYCGTQLVKYSRSDASKNVIMDNVICHIKDNLINLFRHIFAGYGKLLTDEKSLTY